MLRGRALWTVAVLGVLALAPACLQLESTFRCESPEACVFAGRQGTCEATHFCSFSDPTCLLPKRRYAAHAGDGLAGRCVAEPGDDGGADGPCGGGGQRCCADRTCEPDLLAQVQWYADGERCRCCGNGACEPDLARTLGTCHADCGGEWQPCCDDGTRLECGPALAMRRSSDTCTCYLEGP